MLSNHSDDCVFYIDESGDLGFGPGASRHFVIAAVCVNRGDQVHLKRSVKRFRINKGLPSNVELKASSTKLTDRNELCRHLALLPCSIHYVAVNKSRVKQELRRDTNILYNYLAGLMLAPLICVLKDASVQFDCRTIKVASGNSLSEYLRIKLWCEMNASVSVQVATPDSRQSLGIQAADFVSNAVFRKYERNDADGYNELVPIMGTSKELFF